jgi:hypothetical protein
MVRRTAVNPWQWSLQFGFVARLAFPELLVELEATAMQ